MRSSGRSTSNARSGSRTTRSAETAPPRVCGVAAERTGPVGELEVDVDGNAQHRCAVVAMARHDGDDRLRPVTRHARRSVRANGRSPCAITTRLQPSVGEPGAARVGGGVEASGIVDRRRAQLAGPARARRGRTTRRAVASPLAAPTTCSAQPAGRGSARWSGSSCLGEARLAQRECADRDHDAGTVSCVATVINLPSSKLHRPRGYDVRRSVSVIGAGSWGTTVAAIVERARAHGALGPRSRGGRRDQPHARERRLPARDRACRTSLRATADLAAARARCRRRGHGRAVARIPGGAVRRRRTRSAATSPSSACRRASSATPCCA